MAATRMAQGANENRRSCVVFEEHDDMLWLRGKDAELATDLLGLRWEGEAIGFERGMALVHADSLLGRHVEVCIREGAGVRTLSRRRQVKPSQPVSTLVRIRADAFFDERELLRIKQRLASSHSSGPFDHRDASDDGSPPIYVYKVDVCWYEVDWQLTAMSEAHFQGLVLAAHEACSELSCQLVEAKPRRRIGVSAKGSLQLSEPVVYGQMSLQL